MATLKELYTTLKSLRDMHLPVDEKLLKAADDLEETIIKQDILPSLSNNIEPLLNEIQRELVLVVEYHPGDPIKVALSRKTRISEIIDAKTLTPLMVQPISRDKDAFADIVSSRHIENHTKGIKVTFPDGTVICRRTAVDTFIKVLSIIGLDKVAAVGIQHSGYNLVSRKMRPIEPGNAWQHKVEEYYIYSKLSNAQKMADLRCISKFHNLGLIIEEGK